MPKQDWRDHWLWGALDIWLTASIAVELIAAWRWGWIGVLAVTTLLILVIAVGLTIEKRIRTARKSN
jgi:hypothetical protein